jgi:cysteine desulfurase/selenocysteine lyase
LGVLGGAIIALIIYLCAEVTVSTSSYLAPAYDLEALRSQFEITQEGITYLNHAGMSPLPRSVKQAMVDAVEAMAQQGSGVYTSLLAPLEQKLHEQIARLVNASPDEVAFVENTSIGINFIAQSLPLQPGDNVLLCDVEFPANVYPWQNLASKGIETRLLPSRRGGLSLEALDSARDAHSRVVAVSGVQFFTGRREDLFAIGDYCAEHGLWLIVDGMQAAGIVPLDMQAMGIHALVAGGQKALLAPPGQGFMVVRADLIERLQPVFVGPLSVVNHEHWLHYDLTLKPGARRFDLGTSNIAGLAGLLAAVNLLLEVGVEHIANWVTHLSDVAIRDLVARGYRVITPLEPEQHANIVTFAIDGDPDAITAALGAQGVILRPHLDAAGNPYLRISTHGYNTENEVLRVAEVLEEIDHEQY